MPPVIPVVTTNKPVSNNPFQTNLNKDFYKKKEFDPSKREFDPSKREFDPSKREFDPSKREFDPSKKREFDQSAKPPQNATFQPALRVEMWNPVQNTKQKEIYGLYPQYIANQLPPDINPNLKHLFAPTTAFSYGPNVQLPMQKVYNITLPGPSGGHVEMNKIYETILPGKDVKLTFTTLGERLKTYEFVRQVLIQINDGEDISLECDAKRNLMSYIKFMDLNPNYYSPLFSNPYRGLPFGLLIYRSCFPIQLEEKSQTTMCSKNSTGMNIRLYSLSYAEIYSYQFKQPVYREYDVWRELIYYEYVRENILKKKQSPNFTMLYAFFFSFNQKLDYFNLKKKTLNLTQKELLSREYKKFKELHESISKDKVIRPPSMNKDLSNRIPKLPDEKDTTLQKYSGTTLILITEAPHHNLYQWASKIYNHDGIVDKMISHGFHDTIVWMSILFQIVSALYVMQLHGLYIRDMTIEDNIYIKDLANNGESNIVGYWKYIIDDIPYYVPNFGYLVMIDSNFKDIIPATRLLEPVEREYKIYTNKIFGQNYQITQLQRQIWDNYRRIINTNAFTKEHTLNNVNKPSESVMSFIGKLMEDNEIDLGTILLRHFGMYMNNRIGTYLRKDSEIPNIREHTGPFKKGQMCAEVIEDQVYKWCIFVKYVGNDGEVEIITKDKPESTNVVINRIRVDTLKQFALTEKIDQIYDGDKIKLNENELLETYFIN